MIFHIKSLNFSKLAKLKIKIRFANKIAGFDPSGQSLNSLLTPSMKTATNLFHVSARKLITSFLISNVIFLLPISFMISCFSEIFIFSSVGSSYLRNKKRVKMQIKLILLSVYQKLCGIAKNKISFLWKFGN